MNPRLDRRWNPRKEQAAIHQLASRIKEQIMGFLIHEPALSVHLQLGRPSCYMTLMRQHQALVVRFSNHPLPEKRTKTQILSRQMPVDFMNLERVLEVDPGRILDRIKEWIATSGALVDILPTGDSLDSGERITCVRLPPREG